MPIVYTDTPESTAIGRVGYDVDTQTLLIAFRDRDQYPEYNFGGVSESLVKSFLLAESKGKFYHRYLKGNRHLVISRPKEGGFKLANIGKRIKAAVTIVRKLFTRGK